MKAFMTTGTPGFLKKLLDSHKGKTFYFMKSTSSALLYYEDERKKGIFVSGRTCDILFSNGNIDQKGFVVMNNIPVTEEEMPVFEAQMKRQLQSLAQQGGIKAIRLLKENKSNKYIILSQWDSERDYHQWQRENKENELNSTNTAKLPAYFADRPFTHTYYMINEEDET